MESGTGGEDGGALHMNSLMISLTKLQEDLSDVKVDLHEVHEQQVERRTKKRGSAVTAEDYELVFNLRRCNFDLERSRRELLVD